MIEYLLWVDVETTGLDPARCRLLEIAACIAPLATPFPGLPLALLGRSLYHQVFHCERSWPMEDVVRGMHERSGLLERCVASPAYPEDAENWLLYALPEDARQTTVYLAGSSPGLDRAFLREYMPRLAARLHYRTFDVAAVELFARSMGMPELPRAGDHRAVADLEDAIARGMKTRDWLRRS